jgi:hypothetical protein
MNEVNEAKKLVRKPPTVISVQEWIEQAKVLPAKISH